MPFFWEQAIPNKVVAADRNEHGRPRKRKRRIIFPTRRRKMPKNKKKKKKKKQKKKEPKSTGQMMKEFE